MARPKLVVSDLDHTLLGDDEALERFADMWERYYQGTRLVYASGRFYDSVVASISGSRLPRPDAIIGGVGTEIRLYPTGDLIPGWQESWWHAWDAGTVRRALAGRTEMVPQADEFQSEYKISFHVREASDTLLRCTHLAVLPARADLIYSSNRDLDIVPAGVNKGSAAAFLARRWGIPRGAVVVAGDSGNDLSMFMHGFCGVVVANAEPVLKELRGPRVYVSCYTHADGVRDGLTHWNLADRP